MKSWSLSIVFEITPIVYGRPPKFNQKRTLDPWGAVARYRDSVVRVTRKTVISPVKMGKEFAKNQSKANIPNDKIGKK
jgi:hypothetical protein